MSGMEVPLMFVAAAMAAAGGVAGYTQGQYQKQVAEQNQEAAKTEASAISEIESADGRKAVGAATARAGASGLTVGGSASDVIGSLAAAGEFNARRALYAGSRRVAQYKADAVTADGAATASLIRGATAATSLMAQGSAGMGG